MGREGRGGGIMCLKQEQPVRRPQVNSTNGKGEEVGGRRILCLRQEQPVWRPQVNSTNGKGGEGRRDYVFEARATCLETTGNGKGGEGRRDYVFEARATCFETTGELNQWEGGGGRGRRIMCWRQEQHVYRPQVNSANGKGWRWVGGGGFCV